MLYGIFFDFCISRFCVFGIRFGNSFTLKEMFLFAECIYWVSDNSMNRYGGDEIKTEMIYSVIF